MYRALGQQGGAAYSPWVVTSRHVASVSALLTSAPQFEACAHLWKRFVRKQVAIT